MIIFILLCNITKTQQAVKKSKPGSTHKTDSNKIKTNKHIQTATPRLADCSNTDKQTVDRNFRNNRNQANLKRVVSGFLSSFLPSFVG